MLNISVQAGTNIDVEATKYQDDVGFLSELGILKGYDDGTFLPEGNVTRAEFVSVLVRAFKLENQNDPQRIFYDVPTSHWAAENINTVARMGIVKGDGEGKFLPDNLIAYNEAIKCVMFVLGYSFKAEALGGFPVGYLKVASDADVSINRNQSSMNITRGDLAIVIKNAIEAPIMRRTVFGSEENYEIDKNYTVLGEQYNIYKTKGIINANDKTKLVSSESGLILGDVDISGIKYDKGNTNADQLLGRNISFYYEQLKDDDEKKIIYIEKENKLYTELNISAEDFVSFLGVTLKYQPEDDIKSVEVIKGADFIYNGNAFGGYTPDDVAIKSGYLTLVDNNKDGEFDVIFATEYVDYTVDNINESDMIVYNKNGTTAENTMYLDLSEQSNKFITYYKNGKPAKFSDIKKKSILSVVKSKNESVFVVDIVDEKISGIVEEKRNSDYFEIKIDGKWYEIANQCNATPELGSMVNAYLDIEGKIANFEVSLNKEAQYGYILDMSLKKGLSGDFEIKILNSKNERIVAKLADKMKINRDDFENVNTTMLLNGGIWDFSKDDIENRKLVLFELNLDKQVNAIYLPDDSGTPEFKHAVRVEPHMAGIYYSASNSIGGKVFLSDKTALFVIPLNYNEDDYYVANSLNNETNYEFDSYNNNPDSLTSNAIVFTYNPLDIWGGSSALFVDKVLKCTNSEGIIVQKIQGIWGGNSGFELLAPNDNMFDNIKKGDIIIFGYNQKNECKAFTKLFDSENLRDEYVLPSEVYTGDLMTVYGKIEKIRNGYAEIIQENYSNGNLTTTRVTQNFNTSPIVCEYDKRNGTIKTSNESAIAIGEYVFIKLNISMVKEVCIVKNN